MKKKIISYLITIILVISFSYFIGYQVTKDSNIVRNIILARFMIGYGSLIVLSFGLYSLFSFVKIIAEAIYSLLIGSKK